MNYRSIFHNDKYLFGEMQVLSIAQEYFDNPDELNFAWVYCGEFVKRMICIKDEEVEDLYVDFLTRESVVN